MRARLASAVVATGLVCAVAAPAFAAPGELDPTFGGGGIAATPFGVTATATGVARGPDGRTVITGDKAGAAVLVARFTAAGALDASFAATGSRLDRFGGGEALQRGSAVAVMPDGSVVVAGVAGDAWLLTRYRPDGSPDGLFGAGGVALRDPSDGAGFPAGTGPHAIAIAADGAIVVAGSSGVETDDGRRAEQIVVARYSARGVPDPSFGQNGFAILQLGRGSRHRHAQSGAASLALLGDGRVVIAGQSTDGRGADRAFIARLTAAGALDESFASSGRRLLQLGQSSATRRASSAFAALTLRADGTLLTAGRASDVSGHDAVALARFTTAGALDGGFGRAGLAVSQLGDVVNRHYARSFARALAVTPDGGALAAGAATGGGLVTRFDAGSGLQSCGFGTRGRTLLPAGSIAGAVAQPDGALLVAGRRSGGGALLARVLGATAPTHGRAPPRLVSLAIRATRGGGGYLYGYLDGRCSTTRVRFEVIAPTGRTGARTHAQLIRAGSGPQVVCARLRGVQAGRRYRIHMVSQGLAGSFQELHVPRMVARHAKFPQQGCVR